jgi:hypothetical protein
MALVHQKALPIQENVHEFWEVLSGTTKAAFSTPQDLL